MIKELLRNLFIDAVLKADIDFLRKIVLFKGLSERSLAKIALIVFKKTYLAGEKIYEPNQDANVVYIVKSGQVKLNSENINKIVDSGDFFGEISLIENHRHSCETIALKDSELYLIYRAKFEDIAESDNKAGLIIMKNLASIFTNRA
ncbi:MAG: cyclic nucleotide-binding domain-containing protein [Endomicrobium sp.]|jgi:CRP-like cAMP-binding protein|nr:cyclic nucleotide-binding domain-containing protein [Endomicrobium sp.]